MPRLPDASSFGALPTPQPGTSMASYQVPQTGTLAGEGMMRAGSALMREAGQMAAEFKVEQERVDNLHAEAAYTKLRQKQIDLTVGDGGFATLKGSAAINGSLVPDYQKKFAEAKTQIGGELANERQRQIFTKHAGVSDAQFTEGLYRHVYQQGDVYAKEVFDGTVNTEVHSATANWQDPASVGVSILRIENAVKNQAERNNWDPTFAESIRQEKLGKVHSAVVGEALASGQYKYAQQWADAHKGEIDKPTAVLLEKAVEQGTQKQLYAGYSANLLANENSPKGLTELAKAVSGDTTLDPLRQTTLLGSIQHRQDTLENKARVVEERRVRLVERSINRVNSMTLSGYEPTPEQLAPILNAARGTELEGDARQMVQTANLTRQFRTAPPQAQEQYLTDLETQARKDPSKFDVTVIGRLRTIFDNQRTAVKEDPNTFAVRQGLVDPSSPAAAPLDLSKPETLGPQLEARFNLGRTVAARYAAPFKPLRQEEVAVLTNYLKNADAPTKRTYFAGLATATKGDADGYKAIMAQIAPAEPAVSIAGVLANKEQGAAKGAAVADLILAGQDIRHPNKKTGEAGVGSKIMPADKDLKTGFQSYEKDAFAGLPNQREAYFETASNIYAKLSADSGDYSQVLNSSRWEDSIRMATGGIEKWNGKAVVMPWGMDKGQFSDGVSQRLQDLVASGRLAEGVTYGRLYDMPVEMAGDGRYLLKAGDGVLVDKAGKPVFLDFNQQPATRAADAPPTDAELREAAKPARARKLKP